MSAMSFPTLAFLTVRAVHVLLAAVWVGSVAFMVLFVMPASTETGPAAGPMMAAIARRGLNGFIVTGFYLYWRFTGGFDPALSATRAAMVFGTGGIAGLISVIVGGAVVGRNMAKMAALAGRARELPEGAERARLTTDANAARDRGVAGARIVLVLQMIAVLCMAVGHYV